MDYVADPEGGMKEKGAAEAAAPAEQPKVEPEAETTFAAEESKPEDTVGEKAGTEAEGGSGETTQGSEDDSDESEKSED